MPRIQKTFSGLAPFRSTISLKAQVTRLLPAMKINTAFGSPSASRNTRGLAKAMLMADPCVYSPAVNVKPPISAPMLTAPALAFPAFKAASPSVAQPALSGVETTLPTKLPVIDVPGNTPRFPWMTSQSNPPAQVLEDPAITAKSSHSPRSMPASPAPDPATTRPLPSLPQISGGQTVCQSG